jgi:hypothetical protein
VDLRFVLAAALVVVAVVLWAVALALGRVDARVTARGFRNGALIALVLFAVTVAIVTFVFNGRAVFVDTLDLAGAFDLGLVVGAVVAVGYLLLGAILIAIGLIFRSKPQWSTLGAWAAVPVIVVSLGFGYVSYRSVSAEGQNTTSANGSITLDLEAPQQQPITASGPATCTTTARGEFNLHAGTNDEPLIVSDDGRVVTAALSTPADFKNATVTLSIPGLDVGYFTTTTAVGSGPTSGQVQLTAQPWTGTLTWSCNG